MVIVDTSVWVDFIRVGDTRLGAWMAGDQILQHPFVTAEISMGSFRSSSERARLIDFLESFAQLRIASAPTFHAFVAENRLFGTGIGFADVHILEACAQDRRAQLATRDKHLAEHAKRLGIAVVA